MAFKHPLGRSGTVRKSTLSTRPDDRNDARKISVNFAGEAVETAEIAELREARLVTPRTCHK